MKKTTLFFTVIAVMAFLWNSGCKEARDPILVYDLYFSMEGKDGAQLTGFDVGAEYYSQTVSISCSSSWKIEPRETAGNWVEFSPNTGNKKSSTEIKIKANPKPEERSAVLDVFVKDELFGSINVHQQGAGDELKVSPTEPVVSNSGGELTLTIMGRSEGWTYEIESIEESIWMTERSKTNNELVLDVEKMSNARVSRKAVLRFWIEDDPDVSPQYVTVTQKNIVADLLDICFNNDGTATDLSPNHYTIDWIPGSPLNVYWNEDYKRYTAQFERSTNLGANISNAQGFYRFDYQENTAFQNALKDGHSIEVLLMMSKSAPNRTTEIKPFASHESGGTGILINSNNAYQGGPEKGTTLQFLPYAGYSVTNTQLWSFPGDYSNGVEPVVGEYYHIVGVYDKVAKTSKTYVDGVLSLSAEAAFDLKLSTALYFCVGGDPTTNQTTLQASWVGDIVIARVYDDPLSLEDVQNLWKMVKDGKKTKSLRIPDASLSEYAEMSPGSPFLISGTGFENGDIIRFESTTDENSIYTCDTKVFAGDNFVKASLPENIDSDDYRVVVVRGDQVYALGITSLTVTTDGTSAQLPGIVAHRGYWAEKGNTSNVVAPHNSIASLERALNKDFYGTEFDVWVTSDNVLVLNHDSTINGISIENSTYAQIENQTLSNGEKIPTLDAFLTKGATDPDTKLVLEIKTHSAADRNMKAADLVVEMVEAKGLKSQVEYIAFSYDICKRILEKDPSAMVGYLNGDKDPATVFGDGIKCIDYQYSTLKANPRYVSEAHKLGMTVNVWTVNSRSDMISSIALGVDLITTDDPETLQDLNAGLLQ